METNKFREMVIAETTSWHEYCYTAWERAGKLPSLDPSLLYSNPIKYSEKVYDWFECEYETEFKEVFRRVRPESDLIKNMGDSYSSFWSKYFDPWSLWKQIRSLFAFSSAINEVTRTHIELAIAYIIGQGVPSMASDNILDSLHSDVNKSHLQGVLPFCISSYISGLELIRFLNISDQVETSFLQYSKKMYQLMWSEFDDIYKIPLDISANHLAAYIQKESRLLSSVFFSITIEWSFLLSGQNIPECGKSACESLRKVRQLNDELIDCEDDFINGIATYPILHALASKHSREMLSLLEDAWCPTKKKNNITTEMVNRFKAIMVKADSYSATAQQSINELMKAAGFIMEYFQPEKAFGISLIVNQRISTILKRANNNWNDVPDLYAPKVVSMLNKCDERSK